MRFEGWRQDLQLAWRALRQARGFTGTAVFTLALGIGGALVLGASALASYLPAARAARFDPLGLFRAD